MAAWDSKFCISRCLASLVLAIPVGCARGFLDPAGPVAQQQQIMFWNVAVIMGAIIIPIIIAVPMVAWWWREGNPRARYRPDWAFSGRLELLIWSIPALTIILLGGIAWVGAHALDPAKPLSSRPPLDVQVVSLDWKWLFIYPELGIASVNRLVTPVGVPVRYSLTSGSVMTAFWVPRLGSMIYVMNGMSSRLNLQADRPGVFEGGAAHIAGNGFSDMRFQVVAVPTAQWNRWLAATRRQGGVLDRDSYLQLASQSVVARPYSFASVAPRLYDQIVAQAVPPGPGPRIKESIVKRVAPK